MLTPERSKSIIDAVHMGHLVECTTEEYQEVRDCLQHAAGVYIDRTDFTRSNICLSEVQRLDQKFNYNPFSEL